MTFRALRALRWLADHPQSAALPSDVVPPGDARAVFDELQTTGLIENTLTIGGGQDGDYDFLLTSRGTVEARNTIDTYRAELVQRRVLEWIQTHTTLEGLVGSAADTDFSGALTAEEVSQAAQELADAGLLSGRKQANGEFFYLEITSAGRAALRSPYVLDQSGAGASASSVTHVSADNYGTMTVGNQVIGGQGHTVTANLTQGSSLDEVLAAIRQLRSDVASAEDVDPSEREETLDDIDDLLAKGPRRGLAWIKATLLAVGTQLASAFGQGLADQAVQIGSGIIS